MAGEGIGGRGSLMPSGDVCDSQLFEYRNTGRPPAGQARVSIEAASPFGWERYVGPKGAIIGVDRFGASAPGPVVMEHYGFTVEHVVATAKAVRGR